MSTATAAVPMTRQKAHRLKRRARGICQACPSKCYQNTVFCLSCGVENRRKSKEYRAQLKADLHQHYGSVCDECGTDKSLEFHHINGDGAEHRLATDGDSQQVTGSWQDLRKQGFPPIIKVVCRPCHIKSEAKWGRPATDRTAEVIVLRNQGMTQQEIAQALGVCSMTIHRDLKKIPMKKPVQSVKEIPPTTNPQLEQMQAEMRKRYGKSA